MMKKMFLLLIACFVVGCAQFAPFDAYSYAPISAQSKDVNSAEPFQSAYSLADINGHHLFIPALSLSLETRMTEVADQDAHSITFGSAENGSAKLRLEYKTYGAETEANKILETELDTYLKATKNAYTTADIPMGYQIKDGYKIAYTRFYNGLNPKYQTETDYEGAQLSVITYPDGYLLLTGDFKNEDPTQSAYGMSNLKYVLDSIKINADTAKAALPTQTATADEWVTAIDPYLFSFDHPQELVFSNFAAYTADTAGIPDVTHTYPNTEFDGHLTFYLTTTREAERFAQADLSDILQEVHTQQLGEFEVAGVSVNQFETGDQMAVADPIVLDHETDDGITGQIIKNLGLVQRPDGSLQHFQILAYDRGETSANQEMAQQIISSFQFP